MYLQVRQEASKPSTSSKGAVARPNNVDVAITSVSKVPQDQKDSEIEAIEQQCYTELAEVVSALAASMGVNTSSIVNIVAIRRMSQVLPESEEDLIKMPYITTSIIKKYGSDLLKVTKVYAQAVRE